ncbi:hypothetical protein HRbin39_00710 [bacterium HR39]|nr:hypothetical protein HRbin39_00710 [bacterium HR39]
MELLYVANPMCSWCWGFQPALRHLQETLPDIPLTLALGGFDPRRAERPMDDAQRARVRGHWERVHVLTGQPFAWEVLEREGFVYDTRPASKAVLVMRTLWPALALTFFHRIQERFYALGGDPTDPAVLRACAVGEFGVDGADFDRLFHDPATDAALAREWADVAAIGVSGYPTLLALGAGRAVPVTVGWCAPDGLVRRVEAARARLAA